MIIRFNRICPGANGSTRRFGSCGADMSPLTAILEDDNHQDKMNLSDEERRILYL